MATAATTSARIDVLVGGVGLGRLAWAEETAVASGEPERR
jgi:hypothetical protein